MLPKSCFTVFGRSHHSVEGHVGHMKTKVIVANAVHEARSFQDPRKSAIGFPLDLAPCNGLSLMLCLSVGIIF